MNDTYLGNPNVKRDGVTTQFNVFEVEEYKKCMKDPSYFASKFCKIIHLDKGLVNFELYDYQSKMFDHFNNERFSIVLACRQSGKSISSVAYILWYAVFHPEKVVAILANKGDAAREVMARVKLAFEALPKWLQQGVEEWNKGNIALENGCQVLAGTTSSSAIRGKSVNFLYLDEVAFIEGYDDFFASVYPTISSGESTKLLMTSTPNGLNHFWKTCTGAKEGTNGYEYEEVMWHDVPGRDEKWRKETIEALDHDEEKFNQEYCCQFLGSSGTLIAGWKLKELLHQTPIAQHDGFMQYEKPIKERQYSMTVDVARGKGLDYSCFSVIDITEMPYKQVAMFRDNMVGPIDFASVVYRIGQMYNTAAVLIEVNDIGEQVADVLLMDYGYDNILYTANNGRSGKMLTGGFGKKVDNGIRTTKNVKATGCSMLKMLVEQNQLIIQDYDTIQEISRFSKKANSFEAESGFHDDLVMNLVLFAWMTEQAYFKDMTDINTLIKLREKTEEQIEEELLPFGLIDSGEDFYYEDDGLRL